MYFSRYALNGYRKLILVRLGLRTGASLSSSELDLGCFVFCLDTDVLVAILCKGVGDVDEFERFLLGCKLIT